MAKIIRCQTNGLVSSNVNMFVVACLSYKWGVRIVTGGRTLTSTLAVHRDYSLFPASKEHIAN